MSKPPQPLPSPPNIAWPEWLNRTPPPRAPLISRTIWPHRLLHVESMTSYARQGHDVYNGIKAPEYNILSYTWGTYVDPTGRAAPLEVQGVDWPIPSIRESHFTAAMFHGAIQRAARGVERPCEWVWVDVACIPQQHAAETGESARLRGEEIGRQIEIFQRAQEAFAWLPSLTLADLGEVPPYKGVLVDGVLYGLNHVEVMRFRKTDEAQRYLDVLADEMEYYERRLNRLLHHPWFLSLWTLQEMSLRQNMSILVDDGRLSCDIHNIKSDADNVKTLLSRERAWQAVDDCEALRRQGHINITNAEKPEALRPIDGIKARLERLAALLETKGLDASHIALPHIVYSLAQHRRATRLEDRVHGIVQTYGISCNPFPPGGDEVARLHALEDEFGTKLVAKAPLLSQLFIHGSADEAPRRSWLVTQKCVANDSFWVAFATEPVVENLFDVLEVSKQGIEHGLEFRGRAWHIGAFLAATSPSSSLEKTHRKGFFYHPGPGSIRDRASSYRGLMLDYHVSKATLGRVVDYFSSYESMAHAVQKLHERYRYSDPPPPSDSEAGGDDDYYYPGVRVALLGSAFASLPFSHYTGLVIAPFLEQPSSRGGEFQAPETEAAGCGQGHDNTGQRQGVPRWQRIGLMRWTEDYARNGAASVRHELLSPPHDFHCFIV